jgi:deoxyribodipyrimidine photolyase-related protein
VERRVLPTIGLPRLLPVFGDQLSLDLASLARGDRRRDVVLMAEVMGEALSARHHKQKLVFVFSAMRHFAEALRAAGWRVDYVGLEDAGNTGTLLGEAERALKRHGAEAVVLTEPSEWRVWEDVCGWEEALGVPVTVLPDGRFMVSREEFAGWAGLKPNLVMEDFYRWMRVRTGLLMEGARPAGGRWNFDRENRRSSDADLFMPERAGFAPDETTRGVIEMVGRLFADNFGSLEPFEWAVTRADALKCLQHFVAHNLPRFGALQDAMVEARPFVHHLLLSAYLNVGLLNPREVCRAVEEAWREGRAPLNSAEGFIRQVIGWREFTRGIYWLSMPDYAGLNFFGASRTLPDFFWWPERTSMRCMREALETTERHAYAHHIHRLMVTGNFALLAGVDPAEVHAWYLAVYLDAFEWVELPNTLGLSQFADGGRVGTKPYAASGAYINRMSGYCGGCRYDPAKRLGADACPFNALYWDFLGRNRDKLEGNARLAPVFRAIDAMGEGEKRAIRAQAQAFLDGLDGDAPSGSGGGGAEAAAEPWG